MLKRTLVGFCLGLLATPAVWAQESALSGIEFSLKGAELFRSWAKDFDQYSMITEPMIYQSKDSDDFSSGYRPADTLELVGKNTRHIYDFPNDASAYGVIQDLLGELNMQSAEVLYACSGNACGDAKGWRLYLTRLAVGPTENQHYVAARLSDSHFAAYVNEVDNRPRLILDTVSASRDTVRTGVLDPVLQSLLAANKRAIGRVRFSTGHTQPSSDDLRQLELMANQILATGSLVDFALVGHADSEGVLASNFALARNRAVAVKELLVSNFGVVPDRLQIFSAGPVSPASNNDSAQGRARNRRVELYSLD